MSNGPINLTRIASNSLQGGHAPLPGNGEAAKKDAVKYRPVTEFTETKRTIPVTDYKPAGATEEPEPNTTAPAADDKPAEKSRHEKWKEAQEAKREKRQAEKSEWAVKSQSLAKSLLAKGDLAGAARALGIPASELVAQVNSAAMGMKPEPEKPKQLTPQEKFEADRAALQAEMKAFREEQAAERNTKAMTSFIEKSIRPVIADKEAFELIHQAGVEDIETYAYRYMNDHYFETSEKDENGVITKPGEILDAKKVLDAIEQALLDEATKTVERTKGVKKLSKYFAPPAAAVEAGAPVAQTLGGAPGGEVTDDAQEPQPRGLSPSWRARVHGAMAEMEAERLAAGGSPQAPEAEVVEPPPAGNPAAPKIVRTGPLTNLRAPKLNGGRPTMAQRLAEIRAAEEADARRALQAARR
jgi:hypothetical protein